MAKRDVLAVIDFGHRVAEEESDALLGYFVETDHWRRLYAGSVDVIYGPKGSGKSALYSLLLARSSDLFDRGVILAPAENPRGTPAFRDLVVDPPAREQEFVGLWKLYFAAVLYSVTEEFDMRSEEAKELGDQLTQAGLVRGKRSLQAVLRWALQYVRGIMRRPKAVEGGIEIDPITQAPSGIKGKITFEEPDSRSIGEGLTSVDHLLELANAALHKASGMVAWILLDRLDVAFADNVDLEQNALRALFRVYLDLKGLANIRLKIFLRNDIWGRLTSSGFREASHITKDMTIDWNRNSLLNLVVRRAAYNKALLDFYGVTAAEVLRSTESQEAFFATLFPKQVEVGPNKSRTFDWMLGRTRDASGKNAPRELIHLLNVLRDVQVRKLEIGESEPEGDNLFSRGSFKDALPEVSRVRLEQTLYAEYPSLRVHLEKLRGAKTKHNPESLAALWSVPLVEAVALAQQLVSVGFFEPRGTRERPEYWIPFIYRDALDLVQGTAETDSTE